MIAVLSKPLDQIGIDDIRELIDSEVPEGEQIEFKQSLRTKGDGKPDGWLSGARTIGLRAKNKILEEAVAFANAYGGALLLGIGESRAKPPVAARISPIPRCEDLAESLKHVFRNRVEPEIPRIEIFAVPTEADGSGVVILRTDRSRMAPHRVTETLKCPIRRSDRCEEMTMREIQDLTLNLSRGLERLERRLEQRSERFQQEFKGLESPDQLYGIRATSAPVGEEIQFDRVYGVTDLYQPRHTAYVVMNDTKLVLGTPAWGSDLWYPMLRAARCDSRGTILAKRKTKYREIHCDGMVEIGIIDQPRVSNGTNGELIFDGGHLISVFANLLIWANSVRNESSYPASEYAVDVELHIPGDRVWVQGYGPFNQLWPDEMAVLESGPMKYPRYSLGDAEEIPVLITRFERDFWNSAGKEIPQDKHSFVIESCA